MNDLALKDPHLIPPPFRGRKERAARAAFQIVRCAYGLLLPPPFGGGKSVRPARRFRSCDACAACSSLPLKGGGMGVAQAVDVCARDTNTRASALEPISGLEDPRHRHE